MPRYRYHDDWQVSSSTDCNFWITCRGIRDALWIAALKGRDSLITVHADCEYDGFKTTAHIGLHLKELRGRSIEEVLNMFDEKVDEYISCRVGNKQWGKSAN